MSADCESSGPPSAELRPWQCEAFDDPPLVHDEQTLRLFLRECLPPKVSIGEWFTISVGCRNEHGLWRRADFPSFCKGDSIPLEVAALHQASPLTLETQGALHLDTSGKTEFQVRLCTADEKQSNTGSSATVDQVLLEVRMATGAEGVLRPLLPVLTPPLHVLAHSLADVPVRQLKEPPFALEQCRLVAIPGCEQRILFGECQGDLGIGGRIWDGCFVLLEHLAAHRAELLDGRWCLELGSGTGLVGMGCALLGAREIWMTDTEATGSHRQ